MHSTQSMIPQFYCQFYVCLVLVAVFGGVSAFCLAFMTIYGVSGVGLVLALSLACFVGLARMLMPPWAPSPVDEFSYFKSSGEEKLVKRLALDTFVLGKNEEMISACSCCPICLHAFETGDEVSIATVCHHAYHASCLKQWLPKSCTCPYCRQDLELRSPLDGMTYSDIRKPGAWGIFEGIFDSIYS
jgi:Ring finger domain